LLCFDGSADAVAAIAKGGEMLAPGSAVVLTEWETVTSWAPYDPATMLTAPFSRLAAATLHLDEIVRDVAREQMAQGVELAVKAGFRAEGRVEQGKPWHEICRVAGELDAEAIVVGARGLGRVGSTLLGSVSLSVVHHARRPVLVIPLPN
jgi:nucleotide-binding universal stress UspA family protein